MRPKIKFSLILFFQIFLFGTFVPILSMYLKEYLGFSGTQTGIILSMSAIPSLLAPFIGAWIVDRVISAKNFLIFCHLTGAIAVFFLSYMENYSGFLITYLLYSLFIGPTHGLVTSLVFTNVENPDKHFGFIRMWGTIGWIVAGWLISFIWSFTDGNTNMPLVFRLASLASVAVLLLTITLPKGEKLPSKPESILPKETLAAITNPRVYTMLIILFISAFADKFYFYGVSLHLKGNGIPREETIRLMTVAQVPEIIALFILGFLIKRLGFKKLFMIAMIAQFFRFFVFWIDGSTGLLIGGLTIGGFIYALLYASGSVFMDSWCDEKSRGGVHQIYNLILAGITGIAGNMCAGYIAETFTVNGNINFNVFWAVPTIIAVINFFAVTLLVKEKKDVIRCN